MPALTLAAVSRQSGLHVQIELDEPVAGGALLLSVTGSAGRLLAQERIPLPAGAASVSHLVAIAEEPLRVKGVLLVGEDVIAQQRVDLHISLAGFES